MLESFVLKMLHCFSFYFKRVLQLKSLRRFEIRMTFKSLLNSIIISLAFALAS